MIFPKKNRPNSPLIAALKTFVIGTLSLLLVLLFTFQVEAREGKLHVVASIFPAFDFVRMVGGEDVEVRQLLPPGVEAHGFSPTPRDMIQLHRAGLFFFTGAVMEPRVTKMLRSLQGEVRVVDLSIGILPQSADHSAQHDHGLDPHFWLDPIKAKIMVETITQALIQVDPDHRAGYSQRSVAYIERLTALDREIAQGLHDCDRRIIISGGHFAFGHFIKRYNLQAISAYPGFSPDGKPSPQGIATLIQTMKKTGAKAVFHEELINPKVSRILVEETGGELFLLHAVHNVSKQERADGVSYISIMQDNLHHLRRGLSCQ